MDSTTGQSNKVKIQKLKRSFYDRPTLEVAEDLIGKHFCYSYEGLKLSARIVETEAYVGTDDPACHASRGKTKRNATMFEPAGLSYIYFIYGMYYCFNFVTEEEGNGAAVLLRAAEPVDGLDMMRRLSPNQKDDRILSGPGKLCRAFGLTTAQNGLDLSGDEVYVEDRGEAAPKIETSPRVGISKAVERQWRFCDADSKSVSK